MKSTKRNVLSAAAICFAGFVALAAGAGFTADIISGRISTGSWNYAMQKKIIKQRYDVAQKESKEYQIYFSRLMRDVDLDRNGIVDLKEKCTVWNQMGYGPYDESDVIRRLSRKYPDDVFSRPSLYEMKKAISKLEGVQIDSPQVFDDRMKSYYEERRNSRIR